MLFQKWNLFSKIPKSHAEGLSSHHRKTRKMPTDAERQARVDDANKKWAAIYAAEKLQREEEQAEDDEFISSLPRGLQIWWIHNAENILDSLPGSSKDKQREFARIWQNVLQAYWSKHRE